MRHTLVIPTAPFVRRDLFRLLGASLIGPARAQQARFPLRAITRGPNFHWFTYYDRLQFDPTGRYALGTEVGFDLRRPRPDDVVKVGIVDLEDGDRWIELGQSRAWDWQQGCMLQWIPQSRSEVIWNDRDGGRFVSHILDVKTRKKRTLPAPIYALSPDGRWAVAPDFRRLNDMRPGYGYCGIPDPYADVLAPTKSGIWRVDLTTGRQRLIIPFAEMLKPSRGKTEWHGAKHWFNHLAVSPDGQRFSFLHRWRSPSVTRHTTRLFTADAQGRNLWVLNPHELTSHYIWRDPRHVLAFARHPSRGVRFYLFEDLTENVEAVGPDVMTTDGHCSYLPGNRWILNDTYPDAQLNQELYLYDTRTNRRVTLGSFYSPPEYRTDKPFATWRCDLHPRLSPDGRQVVFDSPHEGQGRQMYLVDISAVVRETGSVW